MITHFDNYLMYALAVSYLSNFLSCSATAAFLYDDHFSCLELRDAFLDWVAAGSLASIALTRGLTIKSSRVSDDFLLYH